MEPHTVVQGLFFSTVVCQTFSYT